MGEGFSWAQPAGAGVMLLCLIAAAALGGLIVGGFALLWRAERRARRRADRGAPVPRPLGMLALWRWSAPCGMAPRPGGLPRPPRRGRAGWASFA